MHTTELNFDHRMDPAALRTAIENAMETHAISMWQPGDVRAEHEIIVTISEIDGEFPTMVSITDMQASTPLTVDQIRRIGEQLASIILTDSVHTVDEPLYDDGYTMITPSGALEVLTAEEDDLDAGLIVLTPESRLRYQRASSRLALIAAG